MAAGAGREGGAAASAGREGEGPAPSGRLPNLRRKTAAAAGYREDMNWLGYGWGGLVFKWAGGLLGWWAVLGC